MYDMKLCLSTDHGTMLHALCDSGAPYLGGAALQHQQAVHQGLQDVGAQGVHEDVRGGVAGRRRGRHSPEAHW